MIFLGAIAGIVEDSGQITGAHLAGTEIEVVNEPHSVGIGIGDQSVSLLIRQLLFIISEGRNTADVFALLGRGFPSPDEPAIDRLQRGIF